MNAPRSVCVIGAQGTLGNAVVKEFTLAGWTVCPSGRRSDPREGYRHIDLDRPDTFAEALRDVDFVVSAVPDEGMAAERWVMEEGGVLVNCTHAPGGAAATLAAEAKASKGTVLLNAGLVPGISNLVAAELLERYPQADCLEVGFTVLNYGTAGRGGGEFAHHALTSQSHHAILKLPLPSPFGPLAFIEIAEPYDCGFGGVAGGREVKNYLGFADPPLRIALRALNGLGLMRLLPRAVFAVSRGAQDHVSREPTVVWIGARVGAERLAASIVECEGDYRTTAASARAFAEQLVGAKRLGCFNPEDLFGLDELVLPLEEMGVRVTPAASL